MEKYCFTLRSNHFSKEDIREAVDNSQGKYNSMNHFIERAVIEKLERERND